MLDLSPKVLIIDDYSDLREALAEQLAQEGVEPLKAEGGLQGLEIAHKEQPNLILLDIMMPNMDGVEVLKALRDDKLNKNTPVVILTNVNEMDLVKRIPAELNVADYIIKTDASLASIVQRVKEKLAENRQNS